MCEDKFADEFGDMRPRHPARSTRVADAVGAAGAALAIALTVALGQPAPVAAAPGSAAPYAQPAPGRVVARPFKDTGGHLCHPWQAGAYGVFTYDAGRRAFAARCARLADGSGRYAWSEVAR